MNVKLAEQIISQLVYLGSRTFCICPGARCAPFIEVLSQAKGLEVLSFYDERSCVFFAVGRAQRDRLPVVVITTSGTAVAELLPGVIEAYYSGLPLVLITADRPPSYRKQGSPQTLKNPISIFKDYTHCSLDLFQTKNVALDSWYPQKGHLHLNVAFEEPLLDASISKLDFTTTSVNSVSIYPDDSIQEYEKEFQNFFNHCKRPLILVGELRPEETVIVEKFLIDCKQPFYVEALSQLQHLKARLCSGEPILSYALKHNEVDGIIRLGSIPRCRFWRDLEQTDRPVLNLSSPPFYSGLSRKTFNVSLLSHLEILKKYLFSLKDQSENLRCYDREQFYKWKQILDHYPNSEEAWLGRLKQVFPIHSLVFLGNSLPIRLWDKVAALSYEHLKLTGQNGVNGIDGVTSRFFGRCVKSQKNFAILGDLTALYDLSAFWISRQIPPWTLFIINNFGGQIFSQLFKNPAFLNQHQLAFLNLAKFWNLNYEVYNTCQNFSLNKKQDYSLVEIRPDSESTKQAFKEYVSLWNTL